MPIVEHAIERSARDLELVAIEVDRHSLQRCRWRRAAADGTDFAFSLAEPLRDGDFVHESADKRYQVCQLPEPVLAIALPVSVSEAARLGWAIGNLHQPVDAEEDPLLVADDPTVRRLLDGLGISFEESMEIFTPPPHSAASHHAHEPGLEYDHEHFLFGHRSGTTF